MVHEKLIRQIVTAACLSVFGAIAHAGSIGINFSNGGRLIDASGQPGVVAGAHWNNPTGSSGTVSGLLDSTGLPTSTNIVFSAAGVYDAFHGSVTGNSATNTLYQGALYGGGNKDGRMQEVTITVSGVPYALYDLYVYASGDTETMVTLSISDGLTAFYYAGDGNYNNTATTLLRTASTNEISPTVGPAQYQVFRETSSSFSLITGGSIRNFVSNNVFGLQIVEVPEPATVTLLCAGLLGMRRRAKGPGSIIKVISEIPRSAGVTI